eukprot:5852174-Pyramimonas_sp.AAC.2
MREDEGSWELGGASDLPRRCSRVCAATVSESGASFALPQDKSQDGEAHDIGCKCGHLAWATFCRYVVVCRKYLGSGVGMLNSVT